jgi:diguanylate cyclase (GGDEF)-like protein/PAS domain S-box-containing protein
LLTVSGSRFRIWLGCLAVGAIVVASVIAALLVHAREHDEFKRTQNGEAVRAAHQAEASAEVSTGQLASAAAFYAAEGAETGSPGVEGYSRREFMAVARSLLGERLLSATGFAAVVPFSRKHSYEHRAQRPIFERRGGEALPVLPRPEYYPLTNLASTGAPARTAPRLLGLDLGSAPGRLAALRRARRTGKASVTGMAPLLTSPGRGIEVYQPVYRAGGPVATRAERRAALVGFAVGVIRARDLIAAAMGPTTGTTLQLREGSRIVLGPRKPLADGSSALVRIADRVWVLVLSDHDTPSLALPLAIAIAGILLGALIGALLLLWGRNESIARGIAARRIGERDRAEAERQQTERRYRVLAENSIDMICVSDLNGKLVYVSPSSLTLFGFRPEEMVGRSSLEFIHPEDLESARSQLAALREGPRSITYQCRFLRKEGSYVWIEAAARSITDPASGVVSELQAAVRDISDRKRLHQELERLAQQDALTGLSNRRRFEQEVESEMARSRRQLAPGALLLIDLDHFKSVNDSLGHLAGDKVLKQIAEILDERLRESDSLARLGGDEFAILLPDTGLREARLVAESLTKAIREGTADGSVASVTASIGVALFDGDPRLDVPTVIAEADLAMYAAKDDGRDRVRVFDIGRDASVPPTPQDAE